jgi:hypothetical protein
MSRIRLNFRNLALFEDEDWGSVRMAMYATVRDSGGAEVASFQWNNLGNEVDEVRDYPLDNDPSNDHIVDFDLGNWATLQVRAFTHDDDAWPNTGNYENDLGSASVVFDPAVPSTLGTLTLGPTTTDDNDTGYRVDVDASLVAVPRAADVRIVLKNMILYEDEDWGSVHMAIYVHATGPGIDQEIFRWNNGGSEVDEVATYGLNAGGSPATVRFRVNGPTQIWVEGWTHDDDSWPNGGNFENNLGRASITIDPADPLTLGQRRIGPTVTDDDNQGYEINIGAEALPDAGPSLAVTGIEATQAIQHYASNLGPDNSVALVAGKRAMVRVYVDSGLDPSSAGGGVVPGVTGTLTITGSANATLSPEADLVAKPAASASRLNRADTLNFILPPDLATGTITLTAQASVTGSTSNPAAITISFSPVGKLNILMVRVASGAVSAPSQSQFFSALNQLPLVYPIPSDPARAITHWVLPGSEVLVNTHDLTTDDGMGDLLDDLEDIQEESADYKKCYGLVPNGVNMSRFGISRPWDNVAMGWSFIMESVAHELGHVYGLEHAPCGGPDDPDDEFVPSGGSIGDAGIDPASPPTVGAFASSTSDFMSYCGDRGATAYENQWISAYHWNKLLGEFS